MATTNNFGFKKFPPGSITDDGSQFSLKDRDVMDALFQTLFTHNHGDSGSSAVLAGPDPLIFPDLTLGTSGALPGGRVLYYKISYLDENGNETRASTAATVSTPSLLTPPNIPSAVVASTGGTLTPGTYRYALSHYQGSSQTSAPNVLLVTVPSGTNTNKITLTFDTPPDEADGWKIYRRAPLENDFYLLATVPVVDTDYVDDGGDTPDATKRRPTMNTTSANNSVLVEIPASELPLDVRVNSWRVYRSENSANFAARSLVATVTETTTEGGNDLVTGYLDIGTALNLGTPLLQTAIPPIIPPIDASTGFDTAGGRLPSVLAPVGVAVHNTFMPGTLTVKDYNQFTPQYDMLLTKLEAFFLTAPTGVDSGDYVTIRVSDDETADEVQMVWVDTQPRNEVQRVVKSSAINTWTLTFDGQTTAAIPANPNAGDIKTALENLSNVAEVFVSPVTTLTWDVQFSDPGGENVPQMSGTVSGGTITVTTLIQGSEGGDFTLSDGDDTTSAIAFDASGATIATRLETDLASIVDVTVTGTGTEEDPWIITWVDPDDTAFPILQLNGAGLNGTGTVERVTRGHAATSVDLLIQTAVQYHSWEASTTLSDSQEAEDSPAVSTGVDVSDSSASNGLATELDGPDIVTWDVGVLAAGTYIAKFYVAPTVATQTRLTVYTDVATPVVLATTDITQARSNYTPAFELEFESDGTTPVSFEVDLIAGTTVRVDKFEWELMLPTLHAGSVCTVEVLTTGSPSTNGSDVNFSLWY